MSKALVLPTLACAVLLGGALEAQNCTLPTHTFWKNDTLPQVPGGAATIAIIPGLCEGEAAATYFPMPPGSPPQKIDLVSVGFAHPSGASGFVAAANVEIYEGSVTFNGNGTAVLGTKVFDLGADIGTNVQLDSGGINVVDLSPYDVVVADDFVVAFRMEINLNGSCAAGYSANFFTDAGGCGPGVNLLDELSAGWVDPASWSVLCPLFYRGNWVIRACTEDSGALASATVRNCSGANPAGFASLSDPAIGTNWVSTIDITTPGALASVVTLSTGGPLCGFFLNGTVHGELEGLPPFLPPNLGFGAHSIPIPNDAALLGVSVTALGATFLPGNIALNNAIDLILGI